MLSTSVAAVSSTFVYQEPGMVVRLTGDPCELVESREFKKAEIELNGVPRKGCWMVLPEDPSLVFIGDEAGASGVLPLREFKPETKI